MPDSMPPLKSADTSETVLNFLRARRSSLVKLMEGPGPNAEQLADILQIAARVPDHRKLAPFRFITFTGAARADFGKHIGTAFSAKNKDMPIDRTLFEAERFLRAPVVVAVISAPVICPRGTPKWEQELCSGAVCFQMLLAARASGFSAQWLTEWYSYDADVCAALGLTGDEHVAGFIYMGTASSAPTERARPDIAALTQRWII
ncbi:MAG: nitroreductase [Robiginitomaculum sp.]